VNVGVVVHCPEVQYLDFRFLPNLSKVRNIFGKRDADALQSYLGDFLLPSLEATQGGPDQQGLLSSLAERFNSNLQFTPPRATSAADLAVELGSLFRTFVAWRAEPHQRAKAITDTMVRARVRHELRRYFERRILGRGPALGTWSSPDFVIQNARRDGMVYVQSLAKGVGAEIKDYAEQLAGNIFLTRKRLDRPRIPFYAIIHPPRVEQRRYYNDCLEIIHESQAATYEVTQLDAFSQAALDDAA
jgi:hypothetical protein